MEVKADWTVTAETKRFSRKDGSGCRLGGQWGGCGESLLLGARVGSSWHHPWQLPLRLTAPPLSWKTPCLLSL